MEYRIIRLNGLYYPQEKGFLGWKFFYEHNIQKKQYAKVNRNEKMNAVAYINEVRTHRALENSVVIYNEKGEKV